MDGMQVGIVLKVNDVYITDDSAFLIAAGQAEVDMLTGRLTTKPGCVLQPISDEEVNAYHDAGKTVFEKSSDFVGTWREM